MANIIGLIPARSGSKGIHRKNIQFLAGKPLIAWTISAALDSGTCDRIVVSTDDPETASIARDFGAETPFMRPAPISTDTAQSFSVAEHAVNFMNDACASPFTHILFLQPTSPLRNAGDIQNAVQIGEKTKMPVVSVSEPAVHPFLCRVIRNDGTLGNLIPESVKYSRRQDYPPVYALNGAIYFLPLDILKTERTLVPEKAVPYHMPPERSLDIDTSWDFFLAEQLLGRAKNGLSY